MTAPGRHADIPGSLDPADFDAFRADAHRLLDACLDHLHAAPDRPWQPVDALAQARLMPDLGAPGIGEAALADELAAAVLPFGTGNTHPRFFGWVHGTGLAAGLLAEMTAATMNSNCGGRDHGAIYVERAVIDWARRVFGLPDTAGGLLLTGTSQATVLALAAARLRLLGGAVRSDGLRDAPDCVAYAAAGAHSAVRKALELLGHGTRALRLIPTSGPAGGLDTRQLHQAIATDRAAGLRPFCIVATAGSVETGAFDDLTALAEICATQSLWLHVDGAFGCWARLADEPWGSLAAGIEQADSIAFDFHKWMYVQYDCGALLVRDAATLRDAFATRPAYLATQQAGLGGGDPWFCDYGIDLSRGFRALKVWSALRAYGADRLADRITDNCRMARRMASRVTEAPDLELAAPVVLNICCFRCVSPDMDPTATDRLNTAVAERLQLDGQAVFSTTRLEGRTVLRAAIANHRTRAEDVDIAVAAVQAAARDLAARDLAAGA